VVVHDKRVVATLFDNPVDVPHVAAAAAALTALTGDGAPLPGHRTAGVPACSSSGILRRNSIIPAGDPPRHWQAALFSERGEMKGEEAPSVSWYRYVEQIPGRYAFFPVTRM
jgi:hypothetical protein